MSRVKNLRWALVFLAPSVIGTAIFVLIPFADTIRRSFRDAMDGVWVGGQNYLSIFNNAAFQLASQNTLRFLAVCLPMLLAASLLLAVLCRASGKFSGLFSATFLLPMAVPVASVALIWKSVFSGKGLLSHALVLFGFPAMDFINTELAFYVLVLSYVWRNAGYDMVLWQAGLSGIDDSLYEAASIDGAGMIRQFFSITLPMLCPTAFVVTVLSLLNAFKVFREAYLVAGNYPNNSIYLLQHLFGNWFTNLDIQKLTAAAVVSAAVLMTPIGAIAKFWGNEEQ